MTETLRQDDMYSLGYDFEKVAIFHDKPIEVHVEGLAPIRVGQGLGGFHWTIFMRGEDCTACGACCFSCRRRTWWWHEDEPHPTDGSVEFVKATVNDQPVRFLYHMTSNGQRFEKCDYLQPILTPNQLPMVERNGREMHGCSLHVAGTKPLHCRMDPFMSVHSVKRGQGRTNLLSRRLPSRNWRWPQCPIDIANEPLSRSVIEADRKNFKQMFDTWGHLPGSRMSEGLDLWEKRIDAVQTGRVTLANVDSIFFDVSLRA